MIDLFDFLTRDSFILVHIGLIQQFGLIPATLLSQLIIDSRNAKQQEKLLCGGFFISTIDHLEEELGISAYKQREAIKKLEDGGVLETKLIGMPSKKCFRINRVALQRYFDTYEDLEKFEDDCYEGSLSEVDSEGLKNLTPRNEKTSHQGVKKFNPITTINNIDNNTKDLDNIKLNNNIDSIDIIGLKNLTPVILEKISKLFQEYDLSEKVENLILEFYDEQMERKNKPTDRQIRALLDDVSKHSESEIIEAINYSIRNGYKGVFFRDDNKPKPEHQLRDSMKDYPWADPDELNNSPYVF